MKKKILFIHSTLDVGGAEMMRLALLKNINRDRYDMKICCIGNKGKIGQELEKIGYIVDKLGENPGSLNMGITFKLAGYIKKEKPHILHSSLFNSNFHSRLGKLLCRVPYMITEEHGEHRQYNGIKFLPYKIADLFLSWFTDFIICCSEELMQDIIKSECLSRRKIVSIENCIDINMYQVKTEKDAIKRMHGIGQELVLILSASLKAGKGHGYFIDVIKNIKDKGYGIKCFFAGDGPLRDSLRLKVKSLKLQDEIIFLGNVDNIADYLNASDIFILPSFSEGLSIALMEAMYMALPCVVTQVGANQNLVRTGFNGSLVLPGDAGGLEDAILFYLKNRHLIKSFGENSKSVIVDRYSSLEKLARQYYELWDRCTIN